MSYEIFKYTAGGETCYTLQGQGEHEGTNLTLRQVDLARFPECRTQGEFAAELDRRFLVQHHNRDVPPEDPDT